MEPKPFTVAGETVARIHYSNSHGHIPYVLVIDEHGNTWEIEGFARVRTQSGIQGEWRPGELAMKKILADYARRHKRLDELVAELKSLL